MQKQNKRNYTQKSKLKASNRFGTIKEVPLHTTQNVLWTSKLFRGRLSES